MSPLVGRMFRLVQRERSQKLALLCMWEEALMRAVESASGIGTLRLSAARGKVDHETHSGNIPTLCWSGAGEWKISGMFVYYFNYAITLCVVSR